MLECCQWIRWNRWENHKRCSNFKFSQQKLNFGVCRGNLFIGPVSVVLPFKYFISIINLRICTLYTWEHIIDIYYGELRYQTGRKLWAPIFCYVHQHFRDLQTFIQSVSDEPASPFAQRGERLSYRYCRDSPY